MLQADIEPGLPWADQAFGCPPEAINLWVGGASSVTSFHKDPYENVFAVIAGVKTFHLLHPSDVYRLSASSFPVAQYFPVNAGAELFLVLLYAPLLLLFCSPSCWEADGARDRAN